MAKPITGAANPSGGGCDPPIIIAALLFLLLTPALSTNQLVSLQGRVLQSGSPATSGNIAVTIWTAVDNGTLLYSDNFQNAISDGFFDLMLGSSSELNLTYGQFYYLDMSINGQDQNWTSPSGSTVNRIQFQSQNGQIPPAQIQYNAINASAIQPDSINATHILGSAITAAKLAFNAINSSHIIDNAITTAKIVNDAITSAKIAPSAVNSSHLNSAGTYYLGKLEIANISALPLNVSGVLFVNGTTSNVGIGTASPVNRFNVVGDGVGYTNGIGLGNIAAGGTHGLYTIAASGTPGMFFDHRGTQGDWWWRNTVPGGAAGGTARMYLSASGALSINDTGGYVGTLQMKLPVNNYAFGIWDGATGYFTIETDTLGNPKISTQNARNLTMMSQGGATLFLNPSGGNVGIGTVSTDIVPSGQTTLTIKSSTGYGNFELGTDTDVNGNDLGRIQFVSPAYSALIAKRGAIIQAVYDGTTATKRGAALKFYTKNDNTADVTEKMRITSSGNVGLGTLGTAAATTLCYNTADISSMNTISTCSSSARYKEDIAPLVVDKNKVFRLQPVSFKWKNRDERGVGLIAEDVQKLVPEIVTYYNGTIDGVEYKLLTVYLLDIVKNQDKQIDQLKQLVCQDHPDAGACRTG